MTAFYYASEEVRRHWEMRPRRTFSQFALEVLGDDPELQRRVQREQRRAQDAARRAEERDRRRRRR